MAYVSQEDKKRLAPAIKDILKENGLKGSLSVRNHSTLVLTIKSGSIDFCGIRDRVAKANCEWKGFEFYPCDGDIDVNEYHIEDSFDGVAAEVLNKLVDAMKGEGYFCNDDVMTDYFHRSHYINIKIGSWKKSYIYDGE